MGQPFKSSMNFFVILTLASSLFPSVSIAQEEMLEKKSLFERLGGEIGIEAVVDDFVDRAQADPKVNFTRQGTPKAWNPTPANVAQLKKHLTQFLSMAAGNPDGIYEGQDMKTIHSGMKITNAEFSALAEDLKGSLENFNVPEKEQEELLGIVGTTRGVVVEES